MGRNTATVQFHFSDVEQYEEQLQRSNKLTRILELVMAEAGKSREPHELIKLCLDELCAFAHWPVGHAYLLAEGSNDLLMPSEIWHLDEPEKFEILRRATSLTPLAKGKGLPGRILESGKAAWIKDVNLDANFPRNRIASNLGVKGAFGFPIIAENQVFGVLEFFSVEALDPDDSLLQLMNNISLQLGQLFRKQHLKEVIRQAYDLKESLLLAQNRILEMIAKAKPLEEILTAICRTIESLEPNTSCSILLLDPSGHRLRLGAAPSLPQPINKAVDGLPIGPFVGACGTAAYLKKRIISENIETDPLFVDFRALALEHNLRACWSQPIFSASGKVLGTFAMYYHKPGRPTAAELSILDTASHLASVAIERERMEQSLKHSLEDLARSNEELEQFAYIASHDLQEPLRMVSLYLQFVVKNSQNKLDDETKKFIDIAVEGASRMKQMIQDLLVYARVWSGPQSTEEVDFNEMVKTAKENLKNLIKKDEVELTVDHLPTLMSEPTEIIQLFQNLISNAIKFRSDKKVEISIHAQEMCDSWLFCVEDNGIGISSEFLERIFIAFQRLNSDRVRYPGSGIGLAICKKIVDRLGGKIWVESELGRGSNFYFTIPKAPPV